MEGKTKTEGIGTRDREESDDAAEINEGGTLDGKKCKCTGSECHFEWTDD